MHTRDNWHDQQGYFRHDMDAEFDRDHVSAFFEPRCFETQFEVSLQDDCACSRVFIGIHIFRPRYRRRSSLAEIAAFCFQHIGHRDSNHHGGFSSPHRGKAVRHVCDGDTDHRMFAVSATRRFPIAGICIAHDCAASQCGCPLDHKRRFLGHAAFFDLEVMELPGHPAACGVYRGHIHHAARFVSRIIRDGHCGAAFYPCLFSHFLQEGKQKYLRGHCDVSLARDSIDVYGKFSRAFYGIWHFAHIGVYHFPHMVYP